MKATLLNLAGLVTLTLGCASLTFAGTVAPEISGSSAAGAIALISGAMLVLRGRRNRNRE